MDRFEILKYSILLEEHIKTKIIEKILKNGIENSFDSLESYNNLANSVGNKLKRFSKKSTGMKNKIFHCTARELILFFQLLKYKIRKEIFEESFFTELFSTIGKYEKVLIGNKFVRDICAHPTYNIEDILSKLSVFTFLDPLLSGTEKIEYFYEHVKNNI